MGRGEFLESDVEVREYPKLVYDEGMMMSRHMALRGRRAGENPLLGKLRAHKVGVSIKECLIIIIQLAGVMGKRSSRAFDEIGAPIWRGLSEKARTYAVSKSMYTPSFQTTESGSTSQGASSQASLPFSVS